MVKKIIHFFFFIGFGLSATASWAAEDPFAHREPIDLVKAAGTSRLLLVGDDHTQPAIKQFVARELDALQRKGFSCLAIEMIPTNLQGDLDSWTPESQERVRTHLLTSWGDKGIGVAESLFGLIRKAKGQGMCVMALDPADASKLSRVAVNPHWMGCIRNCLCQNVDTRIIVFAGRSHVDPTPGSLYSLLKAEGASFSVVEFAGLDSQETAQMDLKTARLLGRATHPTTLFTLEGYRTGLRDNCMVRYNAESDGGRASNWIVNLASAREFSSLLLATR